MIKFLASRIISSIITLFLLSIIVFSMIHLAPGDPARLSLPMEATEEDIAELREVLGLDKPLPVQYFLWLGRAVKLDFGQSIQGKRSAAQIFFSRVPATLELGLATILLAVLLAIPAGIVAAVKRGSSWDFGVTIFSAFGLSAPRFWLGILLILIFSLGLGWLPSFGRNEGLFAGAVQLLKGDFESFFLAVKSLILPTITLATWFFAIFVKYTRSSVLEELNKLYVKTAYQKGLSHVRVLFMHVVRNALIPIVTVVGLNTGVIMGGAVVTEIVFAWPGVGQLLITALFARDYPLIQATLFMVGAIIIVVCILIDVIYVAIDPRIRSEKIG